MTDSDNIWGPEAGACIGRLKEELRVSEDARVKAERDGVTQAETSLFHEHRAEAAEIALANMRRERGASDAALLRHADLIEASFEFNEQSKAAIAAARSRLAARTAEEEKKTHSIMDDPPEILYGRAKMIGEWP